MLETLSFRRWSVMIDLDPPKLVPLVLIFQKIWTPETNLLKYMDSPEHIWTPQGVHILLKNLFPLNNTLISES